MIFVSTVDECILQTEAFCCNYLAFLSMFILEPRPVFIRTVCALGELTGELSSTLESAVVHSPDSSIAVGING